MSCVTLLTSANYLGIWEQLNNPAFNPIEFDGIKRRAGLNSYTLTAKRLPLLNQTAIQQMQLLLADHGTQQLQGN